MNFKGHPNDARAKLTSEQVLEIRRIYRPREMSYFKLAEKYGVDQRYNPLCSEKKNLEASVNGEDIYQELKEAYNYLGAGWANKKKVEVHIEGDNLTLTYGGRKISIFIPRKEHENNNDLRQARQR